VGIKERALGASHLVEPTPPLFPKKGKELYKNPDELVEILSRKLKTPRKEEEDNERVKRRRPGLFDPGESVFARVDGEVWGSSEMSPPGSSPVPEFELDEDDDSSCDSSEKSPSHVYALVRPDVAAWDMSRRPEYVTV
jgi:hypothetical protein